MLFGDASAEVRDRSRVARARVRTMAIRPTRRALGAALAAAACALAMPARPSPRAADSTAAAPAAPAPSGVRYLCLVRHGMYDLDSTHSDRSANGLNALGREQAERIGARLAALGVPITSLVTSDFARARQTADAIGRALGMAAVEDTILHECTPTPSRREFSLYYTPQENALCDAQLQTAWDKYARPSPGGAAHDVLVCHGNVIRWFVAKALDLEQTRWHAMDIGNASLTVIAVRSDGSTRLVTFSDAGHVPAQMQTWTGRGPGWGAPREAAKR